MIKLFVLNIWNIYRERERERENLIDILVKPVLPEDSQLLFPARYSEQLLHCHKVICNKDWLSTCVHMKHTRGERERDRERERERETERDRQTDRQTDRDRQTGRQTGRQADGQTETDTDTMFIVNARDPTQKVERERETEKETETERQKETHTEKEPRHP